MMLTPNGQSANKIEKVMLLSMWANSLVQELATQNNQLSKKIILAGIGKPTYPINAQTIAVNLAYWKKLDAVTKEWFLTPESLTESVAIDYGDPRGDIAATSLMADAMSTWYETEIKEDNILFTVGGIGALHVVFETLNSHYEDTPGYRVITPFPYYSAYTNNTKHRLHPIDVMSEPGYKLTAKKMKESIDDAYKLAAVDKGWPKAILVCNPSNPLGTIIEEEEMRKIIECLRSYPDLHIIFDEAYAEMSYEQMPSFLKIAPDLKNRTVILRSATKALSAAGERMAILLAFDQVLMTEMLNKNIRHFLHAPRAAQIAYAQTMASFDEVERTNLITFYKKKVDYVIHRLHEMGASMPDPLYNVQATFYALADFSDLFGMELPAESYRALQRKGKVTTDEELAYYLLFKDRVMIAPLSYFGLPKNSGLIRITCSGSASELQQLMDRLEKSLLTAREIKKARLLENIEQELLALKNVNSMMYEELRQEVLLHSDMDDSCLNLKNTNKSLLNLESRILALKLVPVMNGKHQTGLHLGRNNAHPIVD